MINKKILNDFSKKYHFNNELSREWSEKIFDVSDKNTWLSILKARSEMMYKIYNRNESMIRNILQPLKNAGGFSAAEYQILYQWLKDLYQEQENDPFLLQDFLEIVIPYYEMHNDINKLIFLYYYKAEILMNFAFAGAKNAYRTSFQFFGKVISFENDYSSVTLSEHRKLIFSSYYNILFILAKTSSYHRISAIDKLRKRLLCLWSNETVQRLDGSREDISALIKDIELKYKELSYPLLNKKNMPIHLKACFSRMIEQELKHQLTMNGSVYKCEPLLIASYYTFLAESEKITWNECWWVLEQYFYKKQNSMTLQNTPKLMDIVNSQLEFPLYLIQCLERTTFPEHRKFAKARQYHNTILQYFIKKKHLPNSYLLNRKLCDYAFHPIVLRSMKTAGEKENFIFNFILRRHLATLIHSKMVSLIAAEILQEVVCKAPELFLGTLNITGIDQVSQRQKYLADFVEKCALFHDIGKYSQIDIISTQNRSITKNEFSIIKAHPRIGFQYLNSDPDLRKYSFAALCHHKAYDNETGYPACADTGKVKNKLIADLISICDCIDAATDTLGRNYNPQKNFYRILHELLQKSGTVFHPLLLKIITENKDLQGKLNYLTTEKREAIYYHMCRGDAG